MQSTIIDFLNNYLSGFGFMLILMCAVYWLIWKVFSTKLNNRKIQLSKRAGWTQIKEEIRHGATAAIGNTIFILFIFYLRDNGITQLMAAPGKYGMIYEILTIVILILAADTWFYWLHRWMHHPKIYKYIHAVHHKSLDVNPFTSNSFHVLEAVGLTLFILPIILLMPVSAFALGIVQATGIFNNIKSHLGYELYPAFFKKPPFNILITATNHSLHHTQFNGNYGLYFRFWDIICDTELKTTDSLFEEIHQRQHCEVLDNSIYKTLQIQHLKKENAHTMSVYFKPDDTAFYQYDAGQYVTLKFKINNKTYHRCFSLSSTPVKDDFLRITAKLNGNVTKYLHYDAKVGDTVEALYPVGDFKIDTHNTLHVFIAGGSGITPLFSMINYILTYKPEHQITLLYANKTERDIIFKDELLALAQQHPQFIYMNFISGKRRITKKDMQSYHDASFYICGPESLKKAITVYTKELGIAQARIHMEHYADGYVSLFGL
jgi:ferredoxin-NADP reductase/sterol desaturase/sphingolipid hydroxylase (fatty acid hydroxylase superfamily)